MYKAAKQSCFVVNGILVQMAQRRYDILVSVINYRTAELTIACARSVLEAGLPEVDEQGGAGQGGGHLVIVDNASGDGSADRIAAWITKEGLDDRVSLVRSPDNSGFSGGHNIAMTFAQATFYLILNSDAVLRAGFFDAVLTTARARPEIGLFAPRLEDEDGTPQISAFRFAGPVSELMRGAQTKHVTRLFRHRDVALSVEPAEACIEWVSFACVLLRSEMVKSIGPMDEGYFLYFEDAEYCLRARRAGWRIALVPQARVIHLRGGSGPVKSLQRAKKRMPGYFYAARSRFLYQAHGRSGLMLANILWHLGRGIAQARWLVGRSVPPACDHEARDLWINAFDPLGPRLAPYELEDGVQ